MMVSNRSLVLALSAGLSVVSSLAQAQSAEQRPATPKPVAAAPLYQSAFADYKSYREPEVMSWRAANDHVRDAGGMQGHDMSKMSGAAEKGDHDMSTMKDIPSNGVEEMDAAKSPAGQPATMPGHDMNKMKNSSGDSMATQAPAPKHDMKNMGAAKLDRAATPVGKPAAGAEKMGSDMAGHDVASMNKAKPAAPKSKLPSGAKKPAAQAPQEMMDHSKMKNNKE